MSIRAACNARRTRRPTRGGTDARLRLPTHGGTGARLQTRSRRWMA
jgi:hypothetical protein